MADTGGVALDVISDLSETPESQHFLNVWINEWKNKFTSSASAFESSGLVINLKGTSDQNVAYVFVTFELN